MKFSPLAIAAALTLVSATTLKSQKSTKKVGTSSSGVAVPFNVAADDTAVLSAESCKFPTGTFMYRGCGGSNYAVVLECQGEYCTYMERRLVRSTANNGTASVGFPDDEVVSCTLAGTFVFPAMADTTNEENGSSSCRVGYRTGISLDEGTCNSNQEYKIKIEVGGDAENPTLLIHFSKDGGNMYYTDDEPRMAEPLGNFDLQRRLGWTDHYNQMWTTVSETVNNYIDENIISTAEFDSFVSKVSALDAEQTNKMKASLQCQDRSDADFVRVIAAMGCDCFFTYQSIVPVKFLELVLQALTGQPTTVFNEFYQNPLPLATKCVSWIKNGCTQL